MNIKPGDTLEWKGVHSSHQGLVAKSDNGELIVQMEDGHSFLPKDLLQSKSIKLISHEDSPL